MSWNPKNKIEVYGEILSPFRMITENQYEFEIRVWRRSGAEDILLVIAERSLIKEKRVGDKVIVIGEINSFYRLCNGRNRQILRVFAHACYFSWGEETTNSVYLLGKICKSPILRKTPYGRIIADTMVVVIKENNGADFIPCIFWSQQAIEVNELKVGSRISVRGRLQSRNYTKVRENGAAEIITVRELSVQTFNSFQSW